MYKTCSGSLGEHVKFAAMQQMKNASGFVSHYALQHA